MQVLMYRAANGDFVVAETYDSAVAGLIEIKVPKETSLDTVFKELDAAIQRRETKGK